MRRSDVDDAWDAECVTVARHTCRSFGIIMPGVMPHRWLVNWHLDRVIKALEAL